MPRQIIKVEHFAQTLAKPQVLDRIHALAPKLDKQRVTVNFLSQVADSQKLQECTPESLLKALFTVCQWNLYPDKIAGDAYIVPYKDKATVIVGYRGLMKLARRSGDVTKIDAWVVRDGDQLQVAYGTNPLILHQPVLGSTQPIIASYAVAHLRTGATQFHVSDVAELDAAKARSASAKYDGSPWETDEAAMKLKTAIRRLCKLLPTGADADHAIACDEARELGQPQPLAELGPALESLTGFIDVEAVEGTENAVRRHLTTPVEEPAPELIPAQEPVAEPVQVPLPEPVPAQEALVSDATYKAIYDEYMRLNDRSRMMIRENHGFRIIVDVRKFSAEQANDLLIALQDVAKEGTNGTK